jgi:hypothetical protein
LFKLHLERFTDILNSQVQACNYLESNESDQIKKLLIGQQNALHEKFTSSEEPGASIFCDQLNAAKTEMMNTLLTNGVYVTTRINNNYPWDRILREFIVTNPDLVITDYLEQAKERSEKAIESIKASISSVDEESHFLSQILSIHGVKITEHNMELTLTTVDEKIRKIFSTLKDVSE